MRRKNRSKFILLCIAATALIALPTGCGDDSESTAGELSSEPLATVSTSELSKDQFVKQANALCLKARDGTETELVAYLESNGVGIARAEILPHVDEIFRTIHAPMYERQIAEIQRLGAPKGDEDKVTSILNAIQKGVEESGEDADNFFFGRNTPMVTSYEKAKAYGLTGCSTP